jgi:hypothetical protein
MHRAVIILAVLVVAGCQAQPNRPSFLGRSLQDCVNGDQAACSMIDALVVGSERTAVAELSTPEQGQIEKDADAIVQGIKRARSAQPVSRLRMAPTGSL